ncbi:MAG: hypothetical protein ACK41Q_13995 [Candidatus Brocadia sp.]
MFTYEDITSLPEGNYEIIDGEMVSVTPVGFRHGKLECMLSEVLMKHLGSKGYVAVGEIGIAITKKPMNFHFIYADFWVARTNFVCPCLCIT